MGPEPSEMDDHLRETVQADAIDLPPTRGGASSHRVRERGR